MALAAIPVLEAAVDVASAAGEPFGSLRARLDLRSVFARLDGLPQALSGARERIGAALAEIDGR